MDYFLVLKIYSLWGFRVLIWVYVVYIIKMSWKNVIVYLLFYILKVKWEVKKYCGSEDIIIL